MKKVIKMMKKVSKISTHETFCMMNGVSTIDAPVKETKKTLLSYSYDNKSQGFRIKEGFKGCEKCSHPFINRSTGLCASCEYKEYR